MSSYSYQATLLPLESRAANTDVTRIDLRGATSPALIQGKRTGGAPAVLTVDIDRSALPDPDVSDNNDWDLAFYGGPMDLAGAAKAFIDIFGDEPQTRFLRVRVNHVGVDATYGVFYNGKAVIG